jgi:thiol-disulfide isomerase/thioredoxin
MLKKLWLLSFCGLFACKTAQGWQDYQSPNKNTAQTDDKGRTVLVGLLERQYLEQTPPYSEWMQGEPPQIAIIEAIKAKTEAKNWRFTVFLGTWCGDTRRELPRLLQVFDALGIEPKQYQLIGLDRQKSSPEAWEKEQDIRYVPTILVYYQGKYLGRIIEKPKKTLEEDILKMTE